MSRRSVIYISAFSMLISIGLFWIFYFYTDFQYLLFAVFLFFFGAGHIALASGSLSVFAVRLIDFGYVACGCLAAFIGFLSSQSVAARDPYVRLVAELNLNRREYFLPVSANATAISTYAKAHVPIFCLGEFAQSRIYEKKFCEWIDHIAVSLGKAPSDQEVDRLYTSSKLEADKAIWDSTLICRPSPAPTNANGPMAPPLPMPDDVDKTMLCARAGFSDGLLNALDVMVQCSRLRTPSLPDSTPKSTSIGGLAVALLWPLVLAIALALRLTKASADVSGWAQAKGR